VEGGKEWREGGREGGREGERSVKGEAREGSEGERREGGKEKGKSEEEGRGGVKDGEAVEKMEKKWKDRQIKSRTKYSIEIKNNL
jgi:hypothetical protein